MRSDIVRSRWAALGAAVAISLGAGGIGIGHAALGSGERAVFVPITPCRLIDTRPAPNTRGPRSTPLGPDTTFTVTARGAVGDCNVSGQATGLALNVTALGQTARTYLTVYPTGATRPTTSNLNPTPGQPPTPNAVNVDLDAAGRFDVYNLAGSVNVIVDVVGYYADHHHDDRYYTKAQSDGRYSTQAQLDAGLATKANVADVYGTADVYTKSQVNTLLGGSYVCGPHELFPANSSSGWSGNTFQRWASASTTMYCALHLPPHATITAMSAAAIDNDAADNVACGLYAKALAANGYTVLITTSSTSVAGASPAVQLLTGSPTAPAATVPGNVYVAWCRVGAQMLSQGIQIDYYVDASGI